MEHADFKDSPSGTLIPTVEKQWAFNPNPLPPNLNLDRLIEPLTEAAMGIGRLNGTAKLIENPFIVIRPLQRLEALLSSAMEGTYTTASALALAESGSREVDQSTREVFNYIRAYTKAQELMEEIPISAKLIKEAHRELLSNLHNTRSKRPGEFKDHQNFIGGSTRKIADARFVPPPPNETITAMGELERYINREDKNGIPSLIDAALIHYQFETIHPFSDGNGRIGRMLITLHLLKEKVLDLPILYVSPVVEGRKDEYVDKMLEVSKTGDWTNWIIYFLDIVTQACFTTTKTIEELLALRNDFRTRLHDAGSSARLQTVVDSLFIRPVISIPDTKDIMQVTYPTAASGIKKLEEMNILEELSSTNHPKQFICYPILALTDPAARS